MNKRCEMCGRPLTDPISSEVGIGPVCQKKWRSKLPIEEEDLVLIAQPMRFDVKLSRNENDAAVTNVPHSIIHHSPCGFEWGYAGSGPADLALNILNAFVPPGFDGLPQSQMWKGRASFTADFLHQLFKNEFLFEMPRTGGTILKEAIEDFLHDNRCKS